MPYKKAYINDYMREHIHLRDEKCQICGKEGKWIKISGKFFVAERRYRNWLDEKKTWFRFHVDHIIPECIGGETTEGNLRLTCPKCNLSRRKYEVV